MTLSLADLQRLAGTTGFRADTLEKVLLLLGLLDAIRTHPYVGPRVALKGGTALNLFALDVPRLSVDIDLNYVGAVGLPEMEAERPLVEQGLQAACERTGMTVKRIPTEHAGGKWRLSFIAAAGGTGTLELDVNYMLRSPLWPTVNDSSEWCCRFGKTSKPSSTGSMTEGRSSHRSSRTTSGCAPSSQRTRHWRGRR